MNNQFRKEVSVNLDDQKDWFIKEYFKDVMDKIGGSNDPPPNLIEITEAELLSNTHYSSYYPYVTESRQIILNGCYRQCDLRWYHGLEGVMSYVDRGGYDIKMHCYPDARIHWFKFAICHHEYESVPASTFTRRDKCKKCDYTVEYDTSG